VGGSAYKATQNEKKIKDIKAWRAKYLGYDVLGAIEFGYEDAGSSGHIGGKDPHTSYSLDKRFSFENGEKIKRMHVYAKHNHCFLMGLNLIPPTASLAVWEQDRQEERGEGPRE
jgi:hypothetical protein